MEPIWIGSRRQLFPDYFLVEERFNVRIVVNRPRLTGEKCIVAEKPWEGHRVGPYNSVLEDNGVYKMWYDSIASDGSRWLCYAESKDGVHWEKKSLGLVKFDGVDSNIVFPLEKTVFEPGCVFLDTNPKCPRSERFKMVCTYKSRDGKFGTWVFASPNGIDWEPISDKPSFRSSDTNNICFYDNRIGKYVAYIRVWDPLRKVGRCVFDDLRDWGEAEVVFSYDDEDWEGLDKSIFSGMDFYNSSAVKYPLADDVYLMFPSAYYHYRVEEALKRGSKKPKNDGPLDIQFAISRDGVNWNRFDRKPFIRLGEAGSWSSGALYMSYGLIVEGSELWLYYTAYDFTHGNYDVREDKFKGVITRAVLRLDGFTSMDSDYSGGMFTTRPLVFEGSKLVVNVDTSAGGYLRIGVQDLQGNFIKGFTLNDCDPINGNYISKVVTWHGDPDVSKLSGVPVKLVFKMKDAKLYSFQFLR
ncbi:MAG TPA: hypothetical protein ENF87_01585 [Thermoproteales archaeon]|nr:hypothetical protein [Thermoproteales archaeon]